MGKDGKGGGCNIGEERKEYGCMLIGRNNWKLTVGRKEDEEDSEEG